MEHKTLYHGGIKEKMIKLENISTHAFLYKNKLYKNTQAEFCPKTKNKLRTEAQAEVNYFSILLNESLQI